MCDAIAMAVVLRPDIVLETKRLVGHVELYGQKTRGATVFEWMKSKGGNVDVVLKVNTTGFIELCNGLFL